MTLITTSLNSGSNGNCYYVGNREEAIFIDAGVTCKETERRMKRLGLSLRKLRAIFITHGHSDHLSGVGKISRKYNLPVFITKKTLEEGRLRLRKDLIRELDPQTTVTIGNLQITPFPTLHDSWDSHGFTVEDKGIRIGVFTDIGKADENVIHHFQQCHAAYLEANYDERMLETGSYPEPLKERIRGGKGHLSNTQALQLFLEHRPPFMRHLFLSHLSRNNNTHEIVKSLFEKVAGETEIAIASRYKESSVVHVTGQPAGKAGKTLQLSLFP